MTETVDTGTRILDAAQRLVQTRGYNAFSYADVAEEVGIRKASIHYHFPNKDDLGRELVLRYLSQFRQVLAGIDAAGGDSLSKLERYAGSYSGLLRDEWSFCLCGMLAADLSTLSERVQEPVGQFFEENIVWLSRVLEEGRQVGELRADLDPEAEAQLLISSLEGAMLVARATGDTSRFDTVVRQAIGLLEVRP